MRGLVTRGMASAIHEAGHAVVAHRLGITVDFVSIAPRAVVRVRDDAAEPAGSDLWRKRALIAFAGSLAETASTGRAGHGSSRDYTNARVSVEALIKHKADYQGVREKIKTEAQCLVREHWLLIERVAEALMARGQLTGADIEAIIARRLG